MEKLGITQTNVLKFLKKGFKNKIIKIKQKASFSKLMICAFLFIPTQTLSECFNKLLNEKKIFEKKKHISKVSKKQYSIYTKKLLTFFNRLENGK